MGPEDKTLTAKPLTARAFSPFGDVIELGASDSTLINDGRCHRYTDLAKLDIENGNCGISLFHADIRSTPHQLTLLERHPLGSQAFVPMEGSTYLVIVAPDDNGKPGHPQAFVAGGDQGINIHRNTWHGVLTPLSGNGLFTVIDRIGEGANLEEHRLETPLHIDIN